MKTNNPLVALTDYELRNLPAHLEEAGRDEDLHRLLQLNLTHQGEGIRAKRRGWSRAWLERFFWVPPLKEGIPNENAWYIAKEMLGDIVGYLEDIARGWRLAMQASAAELLIHKPVTSVGLEVRYALISTSMNSMSNNIPSQLVSALLKNAIWSLPQALAYAQRSTEPWQRAMMLTSLISYSSEPLKTQLIHEVLEAILKIEDEPSDLDEAIGRLAPLVELAPHLSESTLVSAMTVARALEDDDDRAQALAALAVCFPIDAREDLLQEALEAARVSHRANSLIALGPYLQNAMLLEALDVARAISPPFERVSALAEFINYAPEHLRVGVIEEALATVRTFDPERQFDALALLAPHLSELALREAVSLARNHLGDPDSDHVSVLVALVPYLSEPLKAEVLAQALASARASEFDFEYDFHRIEALPKVIPLLPEQEQIIATQEALAAVRRFQMPSYGFQALAALAPYIPKSLLPEALATAKSLEAEYLHMETIRVLAKFASFAPEVWEGDRLREVFALVLEMKSEVHKAEGLKALAPYLPRQYLIQAVGELEEFKDDVAAGEALAKLAPHLTTLASVGLALVIHKRLDDSRFYAVMAALTPRLAKHHIHWALNVWRAYPQSYLLEPLVPRLSPKLLQQALTHARTIEHQGKRSEALAILAPYLSKSQCAEVVVEALEALRGTDGYSCESAMKKLVPLLDTITLVQALAIVRECEDNAPSVRMLATLFPYLPELQREEVLKEALAATRTIQEEFQLRLTLEVLAPCLSGSLLLEAIAVARQIGNPEDRSEALAVLATSLPEALKEEVLREALADALGIAGFSEYRPDDSEHDRQSTLSELALHLAALSKPILYRLWQETHVLLTTRTRQEYTRDIAALAPVIASLGGQEALIKSSRAFLEVREWWP